MSLYICVRMGVCVHEADGLIEYTPVQKCAVAAAAVFRLCVFFCVSTFIIALYFFLPTFTHKINHFMYADETMHE